MLQITDSLRIDERELQFDFIRAAGPGGQNVNKVATAVQLRFDARGTTALSEAVKTRLIRLAGKRVSREGILVIEARRFRTQEQNRQAAIQRLSELLSKALQPPKRRRPTNPTATSKERRLRSKKRRAEIKRARQNRSLE
jgi:ribosome-associated protein